MELVKRFNIFDIGSQQTRSGRSSPYPTLDRSTARSGTRAVTPDARSAVSMSLTPDREAQECERIDAIGREKMNLRERESKETWGVLLKKQQSVMRSVGYMHDHTHTHKGLKDT